MEEAKVRVQSKEPANLLAREKEEGKAKAQKSTSTNKDGHKYQNGYTKQLVPARKLFSSTRTAIFISTRHRDTTLSLVSFWKT